MSNLFPFFLVLFTGVFFSAIFKRFHLPWVVALIFGGIIIGPQALGVFHPNETMKFIGEIGLAFLMFMAGLETKFSSFEEFRHGSLRIALLNGLIPLLFGLGVGLFLDLELIGALLLGIIFVSSSIAVVVPSLEATGALHTKLGHSIVSATILEDISSLLFLSVLLQIVEPSTTLPLPLFYLLLFVSLFVLRKLLPWLRWVFSKEVHNKKDSFEQELRNIFVVFLGTLLVFELLGLHSIIAGFFAGFVLSDSIKTDIVKERLRAISYGVFIPVFFVIVGAETNIKIFVEAGSVIVLVFAIVIGSILAKGLSGFLAGKLTGFKNRESLIIGASTIPQLSTTLAAVYAAAEFNLIGEELITAMVVLSVITTIISPLLLRLLNSKRQQLKNLSFNN